MFSQPQFLPFLSLLFPISGYTKIVQQKGRPLLRGLVRCSEYSSTAWVASSILRGSGCWQMALLLHCVELGCSCLWTLVSHPGTAFLSFLSTVGQLPSWSYWESYTKKLHGVDFLNKMRRETPFLCTKKDKNIAWQKFLPQIFSLKYPVSSCC